MDGGGGTRMRMMGSLLNVCRKGTIELGKETVHSSVQAVVIVCLKFVDRRALLESVLPGQFIDWGYVEGQRASGVRNHLGDSVVWITLMSFLHFRHHGLSDTVLLREYPLLHGICAALRSTKCMDPKSGGTGPTFRKQATDQLDFDDVCKIFLLVNLEDIPSKHVVDMYTTGRMKSNPGIATGAIVAAIADMRHSMEEYASTLAFVLSLMHGDCEGLLQLLHHYQLRAADTKQTWILKQSHCRSARPSLRRTLERLSVSAGQRSAQDGTASAAGDSEAGEMDGGICTLDHFCDAVRFPNSMSRLLRIRCYLLASQIPGHLPFGDHAAALVPPALARVISAHPVVFPCLQDLCQSIETLAMTQEPFPELSLFRRDCFMSLALSQRNGLSLTQFLHLYVCAYQRRDMWKQCWKSFYPVMSPRIAKDVEAFVSANPFAIKPFMYILKNSSPFVCA